MYFEIIIVKFSTDSEKEKQQFLQEAKKKQNTENKRKLVNQLVVTQTFQPVEIENMSQQEIMMNGPAKGFGSVIINYNICVLTVESNCMNYSQEF